MAKSSLTSRNAVVMEFIRMTGPPKLMHTQGFVETRVGVNDYGVWQEARRAALWTTETFVDARDREHAEQMFRTYEGMVYNVPLTLNWQGTDYPSVEFMALSVQFAEPYGIHEIISSAGGINPPSKAFLRAIWRLLPVQQFGVGPDPF